MYFFLIFYKIIYRVILFICKNYNFDFIILIIYKLNILYIDINLIYNFINIFQYFSQARLLYYNNNFFIIFAHFFK